MLPKVAVLYQNARYAFYAFEFILYLREQYCMKFMGPNWLLN